MELFQNDFKELEMNPIIANSAISAENETHNAPSASSHNFKSLFYQFMHVVNDDIELYARKKANLIFPKLYKQTIIDLCHELEAIFQAEPSLIDLKSPCLIIGDLHGHVLDLFRIIRYCGLPDDDKLINSGRVCDKKYVFLGDVIDRGEFSVETITIVLLLKILYPTSVYLIRGNHEFDFLAKQCGFLEQVLSAFNDCDASTSSTHNHGEIWSKREPEVDSGFEVYSAFMSLFSYIPFAVRIDEKMLCVHGGIGPQVFSTKSISDIKRPIKEFSVNDVADSLLWSDPSDKTELGNRPEDCIMKVNIPTSLPPGSTFSEPIISPLVSTFSAPRIESELNSNSANFEGKLFEPSSRGTGFVFGAPALYEFLHYSNLDVLVRAHECVMPGCEEMFNGRLITVFSASNYCGFVRNYSAVLHVKSDDFTSGGQVKLITERCEVFRFFPLEYLRKAVPISLTLRSNNGQFSARSANNGQFSARVGNMSARIPNAQQPNSSRRCTSISGKSAPLCRFPQNQTNDSPLNQQYGCESGRDTTRISSARTESDESSLHLVSPRDTHKMAGIKISAAASYSKREMGRLDQVSGRMPPVVSPIKKGSPHTSELPALVFPKPRQYSQLKPSMQGTPHSSKRMSPAGIVLAPKVKPRARSEFK